MARSVVSSMRRASSMRSASTHCSGVVPVASRNWRDSVRVDIAHSRHGVEGDLRPRVLRDPCAQLTDRTGAVDLERAGDELGLVTVTVRRGHERLRDPARRGGPQILAQDVQAQVEARRDTGRGEHVAVVDVEDVRSNLHRRIPLCQLGRVLPVSGRRPPVKHSGLRQSERADADRDHPRAAGVGATQRGEHRRREWFVMRFEPGTTTVSARASAARPESGVMRKPTVVRTVGPGAHTRTWYGRPDDRRTPPRASRSRAV